jgi:hypothetical protein
MERDTTTTTSSSSSSSSSSSAPTGLTGGQREHAEAVQAKAEHVRPQDTDKPNEADDLGVGSRVYFFDHLGHAVEGIVTDKLGTAHELLGTNVTTASGRGTHAKEQAYMVLNSLGGTTHGPILRSKLSTTPLGAPADPGSGGGLGPHDSVLGPLTSERKGPRRG